jgi:cytochrome P450
MTEDFDLRSADFIADPFPALAALRRDDPLHWSDSLGGWVLTRYDDVRDCLRDQRVSADSLSPFVEHLEADERADLRDLTGNLGLWAVFTDPPDHTRLRGLMNKAFTSRAINAMGPAIEAIVDELLNAVIDRGRMDVIRDFAYPLPARVIADLLGVPRDDVDDLKRWSDDLAAFVLTSRTNPERYRTGARAIREMTEYFGSLIERRRLDPGSDVTSGLIAAHDEGDKLSAEELVANCVLLLFAGHETTTHLIGNGLQALMRHPEQFADLKAHAGDRAVIRNAVEEMLRWDGPILAGVRVVTEPFALHGRELQRGDRLFPFVAAANRDPEMFPDPDRFDIHRTEAGRHVTFGYGIHFCLGAPLARLEGEIAFTALLRRFESFVLEEPRPVWSDSLNVRGVEALPVAFTRATQAA